MNLIFTRAFTVLLFLILMFNQSLFSQVWLNNIDDSNENFYAIQQKFNDYWKDKPYEKGKGYKQFKRWEWYAAPRVYPSGKLEYASRSKSYEEYQKYLQNRKTTVHKTSNVSAGNWIPVGPIGNSAFSSAVNPSVPGNLSTGCGRVNFIKTDPTNTNTIYAGAAGGGLWKSTNGGASYTTNTDYLAVLGCSDLEFDPSNTNTMYLATGDYDGANNYSLGLLKSTNGGNTWFTTDLTFQASDAARIGKVIVSPANSSVIMVATNKGLYRSSNGGITFSVVQVGSFSDVKFKPGDANTVYAVCITNETGSTGSFYKSTNAGISFAKITSGLPSTGVVKRYAIGISPAKPAYVYLLSSEYGVNGFYAFYKSTNSGSSFLTMSSKSTSPNVLGYNLNGSDNGGQGDYDLAIAVSPTNGNEVVVGGVNLWQSTNGGANWSVKAHWYGDGGKPYVHADIHYLEYINSTSYVVGCDGGFYKTTNNGSSFTNLNGNLNISQLYKLGVASNTTNLIIGGLQDNGSFFYNGSPSWFKLLGGDGMDCFFDRTDNNIIIASYYEATFHKSLDQGKTFTDIRPVPENVEGAAFVAPIIQSSTNANVFYGGLRNVYKSMNKGNSWASLGNMGLPNDDVNFIADAPSNASILYVVKKNQLFKTTNGGTSWIDITNGLPTSDAFISSITVDNTDANNLFVSFSGYSATDKVYVSYNGGTSWINYSDGLPNIPVNCITYQNNSKDGLYIGTDVGVYFRNKNMFEWYPFNDGLPNVEVTDIDINYANNKIQIATFGRGVWRSDLFDPSTVLPTINWSLNTTTLPCPDSLYKYSGSSTNSPTSWSWNFPGATPSTSSAQNPTITFPTLSNTTSTLVPCWVVASNFYGRSDTSYFVATVLPKPIKPTITQIGGTLYAPTTYNNYDWYYNNALTSNYYDYMNIIGPGSYRVQVYLSTSPCPAISDQFTVMSTNIADGLDRDEIFLLQNPIKDQLWLGSSITMLDYSAYEITNQLGQVVKKGKIRLDRDNVSLINLTELKTGIYYLNLLLQDKVNTQKFIKE